MCPSNDHKGQRSEQFMYIFLMFYVASVIRQDKVHLRILFPQIQIILGNSFNFEVISTAELGELTL